MRQGHIERLILDFLEYPATEKLICEVHAPRRDRPSHSYAEYHKIRIILDRMVSKNLIEKIDNLYWRK